MSSIDIVNDAIKREIALLYLEWIEHTTQMIKCNLEKYYAEQLNLTLEQKMELIVKHSKHECDQIKIESKLKELGVHPLDLIKN